MSKISRTLCSVLVAGGVTLAGPAYAQGRHAVLDLWNAGKPAFGVFVPNENPQRVERGQPPPKGIYTKEGGAKLAADPQLDFVFLNIVARGQRDRIGELALNEPELSPRELAVRITDTQDYFVFEASVYRLLKAHDLITPGAWL